MEQQARGMDGSIPITAALMLADHLHEMVARLKNGLELHNALTNEITALCLTEFAAAGLQHPVRLLVDSLHLRDRYCAGRAALLRCNKEERSPCAFVQPCRNFRRCV